MKNSNQNVLLSRNMFIPFLSTLFFSYLTSPIQSTPRVRDVSVRFSFIFFVSRLIQRRNNLIHSTNSYKRKWAPRHQSQLAQRPAQLHVANIQRQLPRGSRRRHRRRLNNRRRSKKQDRHIIPRSRLQLRAQRVYLFSPPIDYNASTDILNSN